MALVPPSRPPLSTLLTISRIATRTSVRQAAGPGAGGGQALPVADEVATLASTRFSAGSAAADLTVTSKRTVTVTPTARSPDQVSIVPANPAVPGSPLVAATVMAAGGPASSMTSASS